MPKEIQLRTTGNVQIQSGLGSTGFLLLVNMMGIISNIDRRLREGPDRRSVSHFQLEAQPDSPFFKRNLHDVQQGILEVVKQVLAIYLDQELCDALRLECECISQLSSETPENGLETIIPLHIHALGVAESNSKLIIF